MFPVCTSATHTAGTLYPSLCPTGYDPVLEHDIRIAAALWSRDHHLLSATVAHREPSVDFMTTTCWSVSRKAPAGPGIEGGSNEQTLGPAPIAGANDHHVARSASVPNVAGRTGCDRNPLRAEGPVGTAAATAKVGASRGRVSGSRI
jgi:hypothetical protein